MLMERCRLQNRSSVGLRSDSFPLVLVDDFSEESSFYEILPCCARFRCGELIVEGQWHHLVLLMSKGMLKNSTAALYIDGQLVSTVKVSILHRETWPFSSQLLREDGACACTGRLCACVRACVRTCMCACVEASHWPWVSSSVAHHSVSKTGYL